MYWQASKKNKKNRILKTKIYRNNWESKYNVLAVIKKKRKKSYFENPKHIFQTAKSLLHVSAVLGTIIKVSPVRKVTPSKKRSVSLKLFISLLLMCWIQNQNIRHPYENEVKRWMKHYSTSQKNARIYNTKKLTQKNEVQS